MKPCSQIESCAVVAALVPNFPKALELLKQKYCSSGYNQCSIFQNGGTDVEKNLIYQNIARVKTLIEAEISGLKKGPVS